MLLIQLLTDKTHIKIIICTFAALKIKKMATERNSKGQFEKGRAKTGGKQKGYESPIKKEFRELCADFSREAWEDFMEAWYKCEPKDKVSTFIKILEFNCPKLQTVTLDDKREIHNALTEKLRQMSEEEG